MIIIKLAWSQPSIQQASANTSEQQHHHQLNLNQIAGMFDFSAWTHYLCEYLLLPHCSYLKRLIKKLLQILCGSKDKYRKFKDQHLLTTCVTQLAGLCRLHSSPSPVSMLGLGATVAQACDALSVVNPVPPQLALTMSSPPPPKLAYSSLLRIAEHLKTMIEVGAARTSNWQRFCLQNSTTLLYLIEVALLMGVDSNGSGIDSSSSLSASASTSVIVPHITQLLLCALGGGAKSSGTASVSQSKATSQTRFLSFENFSI